MRDSTATYRATFRPRRTEPIERPFPSVADALTWLRIQCAGAEFEHDCQTERWTARNANGATVGEIDRERAENRRSA